MEGGADDNSATGDDMKVPLLEGKKHLNGSGRLSRRLYRRNSVNSLRNEFVTRLPDNVRSCVDLESSSLVDLSKAPLTKGEKEYYERQFDTLKSFEEVDSIVTADSIDEEDLEEQAQQERAMRISNYANILLLALKL